jgi:hypothetical protein
MANQVSVSLSTAKVQRLSLIITVADTLVAALRVIWKQPAKRSYATATILVVF